MADKEPAGFVILASVFLGFLAANCYGAATLTSLKKSLIVTASPSSGQVVKAGEDKITVTWALNATFPGGTDSGYKTVKVQFCYAPISQKDRGWRKTVDDLTKDKTCQHTIVSRAYSNSNNSFTGTVQKDVPTATYFVRAYAMDSMDHELGYGQTTNTQKDMNLFVVDGITGRHASLDIASVCFSAFSVVSLFGFFVLEKRKGKASQQVISNN